ncbi:MAG: chorismate synthase [Acidobacteriota bacterium]|nr:chorismate synthase [Acidobacteriota bacterium]
MLRRLSLTTAGESHGAGLTAILCGVPAGLAVDVDLLARDLVRRQHGHGRGRRMQIERDVAAIRAGVRGGETLGSPIALWIENLDAPAWQRAMAPEATGIDPAFAELRRLKSPRPGHADLAGGEKYLRRDLRDILERASARETTARVAAGAFAKMLLARLGVEIASGVVALGPIGAGRATPSWEEIRRVDDDSPLRAVDAGLEAEMVRAVDAARTAGDTLGGAVTVIAHGVPVGLGSHVAWNEKLDGRIAQAMMSVPAVKAVEIGSAIGASRGPGSAAHDAILRRAPDGRFPRATNRAGGLEGGITNGEDVVVTLYKKPIATLREGLPSVNLDDLESRAPHLSQYERSDVTALPAAGVIGEAMLALVLADACLEKFGGDSMSELLAHFTASRELAARWPKL